MLRILSLGSKNWLKPHGDNEKTCHMVFVGKQELYASGDVRWPWLKLIFLLVMVQMALAAMLADSFLSSTQQLVWSPGIQDFVSARVPSDSGVALVHVLIEPVF